MVTYQFSQNHQHDNGSGQIIKYRTEDSGHETHLPHQGTFGFGHEGFTYEVESSMLVHQFHNRHGSHQEEQCRACFT